MCNIFIFIQIFLDIVGIGCNQTQSEAMKPAKMFTRKEAVILSGLTMGQVRKLEQKKIIVPTISPIRYSWNQVFKLRIIYYLRQMFSMQVITEELAEFCKTDMELTKHEIIVVMEDEGVMVGDFQMVSMKLGIELQKDGIVTHGKRLLNVNGKLVHTEYKLILIKKIAEEIYRIAADNSIKNFVERVEYASA